MQVKTDLDHLFVVISQLLAVVGSVAAASRAIFGPLPYSAVVILVELVILIFVINLAVLNASHIVQFTLILNFR